VNDGEAELTPREIEITCRQPLLRPPLLESAVRIERDQQ
jgi:hypothetical protein